MVTFLRYFCINSTVMCCIAWIFWLTESKQISKKVGDEVVLTCGNTSVNMVSWKMNEEPLLTFKTVNGQLHSNYSKNRLDLQFFETQSQLYALVIKNAQKLDEGNYTCEMATDGGIKEEHWELLIKDKENIHGYSSTEEVGKLSKELIAVLAAVPCACFVIIITVLVILTCAQKRQTEHNSGPPVCIRQQQPLEDIYENHLEIQRHVHAHHQKPRPQ